MLDMITQLLIIAGIVGAHSRGSSSHGHGHGGGVYSQGGVHSPGHESGAMDTGLASANARGASYHENEAGRGHYPAAAKDRQHHIGRHNNRDIMAGAVSHAMAKNRYTPEEQEKYVRLGNAAVQGDKGAMNTLENEGIINHGEHRALEEGAAGNVHNKWYAANHNGAHHGGDHRRGHIRGGGGRHGDAHSLRHVNAEKRRMADAMAAAHGNRAAQARMAARIHGYGDMHGHEGDPAAAEAMRAATGAGGQLDPRTAAGGAYGRFGMGQAARTGADAGAAAGAIAGAEAGRANGLGADAGARVGAAAGRRAGAAAGNTYAGRPGRAGEIAGHAAGAMAAGLKYRGVPGGREAEAMAAAGLLGRAANRSMGASLRTGWVPPEGAEAFYARPPRTPEDDADEAAVGATRAALAAGADMPTAMTEGHIAREDARRNAIAHLERQRRAVRDRVERMGQAERERSENAAQRAHTDQTIARKARALEAQKAYHEANLKHRMAYNYSVHYGEVSELKRRHDAASNQLMKDKAEAYLAEDRDKQKTDLGLRAREGDPEAARELEGMQRMESLAYGTLRGDSVATEEFATAVAAQRSPRNGLREMRPLGEAADADTLAAVAAQAGNAARKQNHAKRARAAAGEEHAGRAAAAERRAAHRAAQTGARGKEAADILAQEQMNEDEDAANAAGWNAAQQAAAEGALPAMAAARGAKVKQHARTKLAAMAGGASEEEAEREAQRAANAVPSPVDLRPYESQLVDQEAQRREAYGRTKAQALRDGATGEEAEAAGQKALADTAGAQAAANRAASAAASAGMAKREAAARAHAAAAEAESAAQEEAAAAHEAGAAAAAAAIPVTAAQERDAAEAEEADMLAHEEAVQKEREARSRNHQKIPLSDFIKRGEAMKREAEQQRELADAQKRRKRALQEERKQQAAMKVQPSMSIPEHNAQVLKEIAKGHEEALAEAKNQAEADHAAKIAYENVKALNGSEEQAQAEASRAHGLKRREQEQEKALREKANRDLLKGQMSEEQAASAAKHLAQAHSGKNPTGNSAAEMAANEAMAEAAAGGAGGADADEMEEEAMNSVTNAIPDDASSVPLKNVEIKLPMSCIPNVPAKTREEEEIKRAHMKLRDTLRNKVTDREIVSGLPVIKGKDGYFNVPESAKKIGIKKGKVFYSPKGYNKMKQDGKDTSALQSRFSDPAKSPLPGEPAYYEADASGMDLGMDNGCANGALSNGQEKLDISEAEKIHIEEGELQEEPWEKFSAKIRPQVYAGGGGYEGGEISEEKRHQFEQQKLRDSNRRKASVEVFKGANGHDIAQITPSYGTRSQLKAEDAFNKVENEGRVVESGEEKPLNIAEAEEQGAAVSKFMSSAHDQAMHYSDLLNDANPLNGTVNGEISHMMAHESSASVPMRDEHSEENKLFNTILYNSSGIARQLGMAEDEFKKRVATISPDAWQSYLDYYKRLAGNQKFNQLLAKMDSQPFFKEFKNTFPEIEPSTLYRSLGFAAERLTHLPDMTTAKIVSITPITKVATVDDHNAPVVKQVVQRVPFVPTAQGASMPPRPYSPNNVAPSQPAMNHIVENFVPVLNAVRSNLNIPMNNNNGDPFNNYTTNHALSPKRAPSVGNTWGFNGSPAHNGGSPKMNSMAGSPPLGPGQRQVMLTNPNDILVRGQQYGPQYSTVPVRNPSPGPNTMNQPTNGRALPIVPIIPESSSGSRPMH